MGGDGAKGGWKDENKSESTAKESQRWIGTERPRLWPCLLPHTRALRALTLSA